MAVYQKVPGYPGTLGMHNGGLITVSVIVHRSIVFHQNSGTNLTRNSYRTYETISHLAFNKCL